MLQRRGRVVALVATATAIAGVTAGLLAHRSQTPGELRETALVAYGTRSGAVWSLDPFEGRRSRLFRLANGFPFMLTWSPDGTRVAFVLRKRSQSPQDSAPTPIVVSDLRGHRQIRLTPSGGGDFPVWSPDGKLIAYGGRDGISVVRPDGGDLRHLHVVGNCPVFSRDGSQIAYCGPGPTSDSTSVWTVGRDGTSPQRLTHRAADESPAGWSPDGKRILFTTNRDGNDDIWTISSDGSDARPVLARRGSQDAAAWLPDGNILFVDWSTKRSRWGLLIPSGSVRWLTHLRGLLPPLAWLQQPTGRAQPTAPPVSPVQQPTELRRVLDVGSGRRLFIDCLGDGPKTVVFDAGLGVASDSWGEVQRRVSHFARACRFDRPGLGLSGPPGNARTSDAFVRMLRRLLRQAQLRPPFVLVGASFGGLDVRLYASRYPREVAGVVLVDAIAPGFDRQIEPLLTPSQRTARRKALEANPEHIRFADIVESEREVGAARRRLSLPLVVIRHGIPFSGRAGFPSPSVERLWLRLQVQASRLSPLGRVVIARRSGHRIAESEPALVAREIREVLAQGH
jgi:hypothetical protein